MNKIERPNPYFEVIRALHRGGLGLWLNRKTLMPMTLVPIIVTFLTLMVMRANFPDNEMPSEFVSALIQIPADFVTGIFCALIIVIIMKAPKKSDKDKPVLFTLNIMERKDLLLAGAIAHVVIVYLFSGVLGAMQLVFEPIQAASQAQEAPNMMHTIMLFGLMGFIFYAMRFLLLPILIIGQIDIKSFFQKNHKVGFSLPIFAVKLATGLGAGVIIIVVNSLIAPTENVNPTQMAIGDFVSSLVRVIATAWGYAALSIGVRQMLEGRDAS